MLKLQLGPACSLLVSLELLHYLPEENVSDLNCRDSVPSTPTVRPVSMMTVLTTVMIILMIFAALMDVHILLLLF